MSDQSAESGALCVGCREDQGDCCHIAPSMLQGPQPACDCAGLLIETNAHEDSCALMQERWDDSEYVALWEQRNPPETTKEHQ